MLLVHKPLYLLGIMGLPDRRSAEYLFIPKMAEKTKVVRWKQRCGPVFSPQIGDSQPQPFLFLQHTNSLYSIETRPSLQRGKASG
jgi:hypothetical protein